MDKVLSCNEGLVTSRKCDTCRSWAECKNSFLTERLWHCESCVIASELGQIILSDPENSISCIKTYILDEEGFDYQIITDDEDTLTSAKPLKDLEFKINNDIFITASKDDLIDISRTLSLALSVGKAEFELSDGRKIIVKIK